MDGRGQSYVDIMRAPIEEYLQSNIVILDGGQGTELERRGINVSHPLWSTLPYITKDSKQLNHIKEMYEDFIAAGSNALMTITYQASFKSLVKFSDGFVTTKEEYDQFLKDVIQFTSEQCISPHQYLVGSIGPYAAYLCNGAEYSGDYGSDKIDFVEYFKPQVENFAAASRIDIIAIETVPNMEELKALLSSEFARTTNSKPFYVSVCTNKAGDLRDGTSYKRLCQVIYDFSDQIPPNLLFFGINCVDYKYSYKIIERLNSELIALGCEERLRFRVVYPNSGEIYDGKTYSWSPNPEITSDETWEYLVSKLIDQNCCVIGGCCRTTPNDIRQIAAAVQKR